MEIKIGDHENHRHWDHMLRKDLPLGAKTIMAILSFKQSINASFFARTASFLPTLMIALILARGWQSLMQFFLVEEGHEEFVLVDQCSINKYLGLLIQDINSTTFKMSQPFLIHCILDFLSLDGNKTKGQDIPVGKPLLNLDLDGIP